MALDVTLILAERMARKRGPDPLHPGSYQPSDYGVAASLEENVLDMVITFRSGSAYCCMEWGCHWTCYNGRRWEDLRKVLAAHDVAVPPKLEMRLSCVIEEGAIFFDFSKPVPTRRGWYAFAPVDAYHYQVSTVEAESASPEPIE